MKPGQVAVRNADTVDENVSGLPRVPGFGRLGVGMAARPRRCRSIRPQNPAGQPAGLDVGR